MDIITEALVRKKMKNWKIISRIASISGIVLIVFAAFAAFTTYEVIHIVAAANSSVAPDNYVQFSLISAMLPYLTFAVVAFAIAGVTSRAGTETAQELKQAEQPQLQAEESLPEEKPA